MESKFDLVDQRVRDLIAELNAIGYNLHHTARAVCHIAKNKAERAISFEASIYVEGEELPVFVTVRGDDMFKPVEVIISREVPEF